MEGSKKRARITKGSEVITSDKVNQRMIEQKEKKDAGERQKRENLTNQIRRKLKGKLLRYCTHHQNQKILKTSASDSYQRKIKEEEKEQYDMYFKDIAVGNWDLVKFLGKKTIKHFVGEITDFDTGEPIIRFMRKQSEYSPEADASSAEKTI
ncbi:hypothetical protein JTB14_034833 [Gonioctena quinquepunctata]|nr:hypothetical protein JTB14_034833 [Gonioctena quinquepunctata]